MNRNLLLATALVLLVVCDDGSLRGQDKDLVVRSSVEPADSVLVGQRVQLKVDVLARDVWANLPGAIRFEVPGGIVVEPPNTSVRLSEQIDGATFIGQRYEWWIYPQRQGLLEIPAQQLSVQLTPFGFGKEPQTKRAATKPLSMQATYPDGVPVGTNVICATSFTAEQTWIPSSGDFKVGDGITRTIRRTIDDTPAMILSPLTDNSTNVKTYIKQPEVSDQFDRGALTGSRTDSVTYVFEKAGEAELPAIRFSYWDLAAKKLQTIKLEGKTFEIASVAELANKPIDVETEEDKADIAWPLVAIAGLLAACAIIYRYRRWIRDTWQRWSERVAESEPFRFREFIRVARTDDPSKTLQALITWLNAVEADQPAPRMDRFLNQYGDEQAMQQLSQLESAVDSQLGSWGTEKLVHCIRKARQHWFTAIRQHTMKSNNPLPPLRAHRE